MMDHPLPFSPHYSTSRRASLDQLEAQCTLSPESTTKTADSGIESIANCLSEDQQLDASFGSGLETPSTGNDQVDVALTWHLQYCEKLLEVRLWVSLGLT